MNKKNLFIFILCVGFCQKSNAQLNLPTKLKFPKIHGLGLAENEDSTKAKFKWLPAKNAEEAAKIWSQGSRWNFLNMAAISGTSSGGAASVDIVSDYLGPIRFSLMGNVASTKEDSIHTQNIEKFFSGGGNAILIANLITPTLTWGSSSYVMTNIVPKLGFDLPAMGSSTSKTTYNLDLGVELRINIPFANNNLGILGNFREAYVMGGKDFYQQLNINDQSPFFYSQLNIGITLPNLNLAILFTKIIAGPEIISSFNQDGRISLIVTPKSK